MINLMEGIIPEYDRQGQGPSGSSVTGIVPANAYPCAPAPEAPTVPTYVVIGANADSIYNRLMGALQREDLTGPEYAHNQHRVARQVEIEDTLRAVGVPVGRVLNVKDIVESEHTKARGLVEDVWVPEAGGEGEHEDGGWTVKMSKVVPVLEGCDTKTRWAGPELGQHNREVLIGELGLDEAEFVRLQGEGVIGK
ncbi:hypothetical protein V8D89_008415 [Ganoderma adspersum]